MQISIMHVPCLSLPKDTYGKVNRKFSTFLSLCIASTVTTECDVNTAALCINGGMCNQHILTYTCECPSGYTGIFCEEGTNIYLWS